MIWNYIYEFFVQYIFGGYLFDYNTGTSYYTGFALFSATATTSYQTQDVNFNLFGVPITLGNYLSLICTIIVMALIVWFAIWLVIWVFKLVAHAFLLK